MYPAALTLLPLAYGSVHLGALGLIFPTRIEKLSWEISCIILIAVAGGLGVMLLIFWAQSRSSAHSRRRRDAESGVHPLRTYDNPHNFLSHMASWVIHVILYGDGDWWVGFFRRMSDRLWSVLLGIVGVAYCVARVFLIVESFISLRHVPIGVYQTPSGNFMSYIPHLKFYVEYKQIRFTAKLLLQDFKFDFVNSLVFRVQLLKVFSRLFAI